MALTRGLSRRRPPGFVTTSTPGGARPCPDQGRTLRREDDRRRLARGEAAPVRVLRPMATTKHAGSSHRVPAGYRVRIPEVLTRPFPEIPAGQDEL